MRAVDNAVPGKRMEAPREGEAVVHALSCTDPWVNKTLSSKEESPMVHVFENESGDRFATVGRYVAQVELVTVPTFVRVHATSGPERSDRPGA